jgi:hypothetical protein
MSLMDLVPLLLTTRMERKPEPPRQLTAAERIARNREKNRKRNLWRAERRAKGLPVT